MKKSKKIISFVMAFMVTALPLSAELSPLTSKSEGATPSIVEFEEKEGVTEDGFHWKSSGSTCNILSYNGTEPDVVVPKKIEGMSVSLLSERLFADNQTIKNVDISQCSYFSWGLFQNSSVENVILPKFALYIPNKTFKNCKNLKHVDFGSDIFLIPESAFEGTDYVLPDNMAAKVKNADCPNSRKGYAIDNGFHYTLRDYGKSIHIEEYLGNDTDIVIPESIDNIPVKSFNRSAFELHEKKVVTSLVLPEGIKTCDFKLEYPEKLKSLTFNSDELFVYDTTNLSKLGIEEIIFPLLNYGNDYHALNSGCFKDSKTIRNVHFDKGEGNFKIESHAFANCPALNTVTFNGYNSVSFDRYAFSDSSLHRLEVNADCKISGGAFNGCNNFQEIVFNGNVNSSASVFKGCPLNNVIFSDTSVSISSGTFNMCTSLKNINSEPAFDSSTGDFNEKYKDFIISNFSGADDVGFVNDYVMWHVKDIVSRYTNDSMSDMEKAKVLHDWVCENVSYSTKAYSGAEEHNDLSPFLTGVTVCDGYARSYNLLLHEAGIETLLVNSPDHIWNVIKIGGHYFHVDTTWDDGDKYTHNWFLKSDNETRAETSSHFQWTLKTASSLHDFQSDVLPECAYSMGDCNMDGSLSVADAVKMNRYIMGAEAVDSDDLVLYDLDFSGSVDVFDIIAMRKKITENTGLKDIFTAKEWLLGRTEQISPELDMNGDGVIDVFDMIILRQNLS